MKNEDLKVIVVDPALCLIYEKTIKNNLEGLQHAIGDHHIEFVAIDGKNHAYVDEEGLFREDQQFFVINYPNGNKAPIAGKAIILGDDGEGGEADTTLSVTDIGKLITFNTRDETYKMSQAGEF